MKIHASGRRWTLYAGDCLEVLPQLPAGSLDMVVTDPPYIIGATSIGNPAMKSGTWADMENAAYWFSAWFRACARALPSNGFLLSCGNWRSLPTLLRACSMEAMNPSACMVWDKEWIGPGGPAGLRSRWELVLFIAMPDAKIEDRGVPDVVSIKWMAGNMGTSGHPAEKPVQLMRHLVSTVAAEHHTVCDPFTGSGSTGVACIESGRRFIGIEREPAYLDVAARRLEQAENDGQQAPLFGGAA